MAYQPQHQPPPAPPPQGPIILATQNLTLAQLFPRAANNGEMVAWFPNTPSVNPIASAMPQTPAYLSIPNNAWTPASQGPFLLTTDVQGTIAWSDDQENTIKREKMFFAIHHGDVNQYDATTNPRSASIYLSTSVVQPPNNQPNPRHWVYTVGTGGVADLTMDWQQTIKSFLSKTISDARGEMVKEARKVWEFINPQPNDDWHRVARHRGRLVSVMIHHLQNATTLILLPPTTVTVNNTAGCIKWLLGGRLRSVLDVDALYSTTQRLVGQNAWDIAAGLRTWLEYSCAHLLAEVFMARYVGDNSNAYKRALTENFMYVARVYPQRGEMMANVAQFPWKARP